MGFRHLYFIGLFVAASVIFVASAVMAESFDSQASATIRATATVVPSLGMTAPEDNEVGRPGAETFGVRDVGRPGAGHEALSMHRLLVRFPSLSSTLVTVESDSRSIDCFSLAERKDKIRQAHPGDPSEPGAMLLDLGPAWEQTADCDECVIVTLIYTEN